MLVSVASSCKRYRSILQVTIALALCIIPLYFWFYHEEQISTVTKSIIEPPSTQEAICKPSSNPKKILDVEQIASDFGANYTNKKAIKFVQPATPYLEAQQQLLSEKDKAVVESSRASISRTTRKLGNIESLWNVHNTPRSWQDHIEGLDDEVL